VPRPADSTGWGAAVDALWLLAVVIAVPASILAVGIPLAGVVQLLLWIGRLL